MAQMDDDLHIVITADLVTSKCKHGIERGQCLSFECVKHSNIPVRGEKSWDSALRPQSGGLFRNLSQLYSQWGSQPWTTQFSIPMTYQFTSPSQSSSRLEPRAETRDFPVIGYRGWKVREVNLPAKSVGRRVAALQTRTVLELLSVNAGYGAWARAGATRATCRIADHNAPSFSCECGLYVLNSLADAPNWYGGRGLPADVVIGAVVGWGEVIQHGDEGWRAEYARPVAFLKTDLFQEQPLLHRIAEQYGAPILDRKGLELYAAEYGASFAT